MLTEKGKLIKPMLLRLTGNISGISALVAQCNLHAGRLFDDDGPSLLRLIPEFSA